MTTDCFYHLVSALLRRLLSATGAVLVITLAGCEIRPHGDSGWSVKIGDPVPAFSLQDIDGSTVSSESLKGKPYTIAVFATWCPPCKMELEALEKQVWQPLKDQGASVVGINFGDEDAAVIRKFAQDSGVTFPMLVDESGSFRKQAGISVLPQSLVIGADGRIINLHIGFTDEAVVSTREELQSEL